MDQSPTTRKKSDAKVTPSSFNCPSNELNSNSSSNLALSDSHNQAENNSNKEFCPISIIDNSNPIEDSDFLYISKKNLQGKEKENLQDIAEKPIYSENIYTSPSLPLYNVPTYDLPFKQEDSRPHLKKAKPRRYHLFIGHLIVFVILTNGMFLNAALFTEKGQEDYHNDDIFYSPTRVVLYLLLIISAITFVLRCLFISRFIILFLNAALPLVNGIGGLIYLIIVYKYEYLKTPGLEISINFYGSLVSYVITLIISVFLVRDLIFMVRYKKKGSDLPLFKAKMLSALVALVIWCLVEAFFLCIVEDIQFYMGIYISFVTIATIGFGDHYPLSTSSKIFTFFWFMGGVFSATTYLLYTRDVIVQSISAHYKRQAYRNQKIKTSATRGSENSGFRGIKHLLFLKFDGLFFPRMSTSKESEKNANNHDDDVSVCSAPAGEMYDISTSSNDSTTKQSYKKSSIAGLEKFDSDSSPNISTVDSDINDEFTYRSLARRMNNRLILVVVINLFMICFSSLIFYLLEKPRWGYGNALWFSFIAFTTIGYGDTVLNSQISIIIFNFIILFCVAMFAAMIGLAVDRFELYLNCMMNRNSKKKIHFPEKLLGKVIASRKKGRTFSKKRV
ncbi:hypothetical protein BB560_004830 [Smittium megazygosporum]|uniref:Potassium channel domain-containing protein n=1 Tax=Smittium megazygosporum TaxID=133381 RepID=A0A2T9Z8C0_9FUNG|nr:hypothetical protein BB560_004830 [Smittium megazygosporum]